MESIIKRDRIKHGRVAVNSEVRFIDGGKLRRGEVLEVKNDRIRVYDYENTDGYILAQAVNGGLD